MSASKLPIESTSTTSNIVEQSITNPDIQGASLLGVTIRNCVLPVDYKSKKTLPVSLWPGLQYGLDSSGTRTMWVEDPLATARPFTLNIDGLAAHYSSSADLRRSIRWAGRILSIEHRELISQSSLNPHQISTLVQSSYNIPNNLVVKAVVGLLFDQRNNIRSTQLPLISPNDISNMRRKQGTQTFLESFSVIDVQGLRVWFDYQGIPEWVYTPDRRTEIYLGTLRESDVFTDEFGEQWRITPIGHSFTLQLKAELRGHFVISRGQGMLKVLIQPH